MQKPARIGVIMATMLEATSFIKSLAMKQCEKTPFSLFENETISLIISGVGKANAAAACTYLIITQKPTCICNLGAAGALESSQVLNATYHIDKAIEPDRPIFATGNPFEHFPDVLAGFPTATLATQDKAVICPEQRTKIASCAQLADMEGASLVQTCRYFQMRCYLFKFVSDTLHDHQIVANIRKYRQDFCLFFRQAVLPALTAAP